MSRVACWAFWAALIVTLVFAWSPHPPQLLASDKSQHELAFVVLTVLGALAYPQVRLAYLAGAMAVLGALIEIVQAIPVLHRDSDIHDWYADVGAIIAALAILALVGALQRRRAAVESES